VQRCAAGRADVLLAGHAGGGVHAPERILNVIKQGVGKK
jgi:formate-dependent nitrite reductase cytochrome c552 subunit